LANRSSTLADEFVRRLNSSERTRKEVEKLFSRDGLTLRATEHVYGALFLNTVTSFERLLEDLFLGLLDKRLLGKKTIRPRVIFKSALVTREVVTGGKAYLSWFPYEWTEKRAEAFFTGGRPFTVLSAADKTFLQDLVTIRNAVAHQSSHALRKFEQRLIAGTPLLPRERTPVGYLRSIFRTAPVQTRYEQIAAECARVAYSLCG
jgi:hypothetical protein